MKKLIFILIIIISVFIFYNIYYYFNPTDRPILNYSTFEYKCSKNQYECKIYILNSLQDIYVYSYKDNNSIERKFGTGFFVSDKNMFYKNKIKLYDGNILIKKLQFNYDQNLNGTYKYNDEIYTFNNGCITSTNTLSSPRPCTSVWQMDNNIFSIIEPIISEIPIYEYEFDSEKNLILYPLASNYMYMDKRLSYTLKRQNY
ncbi:MAG: hypothetical protein MR601_03290 [Erysipelotrichaceae bacterium]|nr:hypothetical protein [Erysipelotrichaceae bacterium]